MQVDIGAEVVDSEGATTGHLAALVFDRASRRVAGFLVRADGSVPRDIFVMPGQMARIDQERLALTLSGDEFAGLRDAREHLYVAPGQTIEEEIAAAKEAEDAGDLPDTPDPDEAPAATVIPGFALLPGLLTPIEVERSAIAEGQVALGEGLRVLAADGADVGQLTGVILDEASLVSIVVSGETRLVGYDWLDHLDDGANELTLTIDSADLPTATDPANDRAPRVDRES